MADDRLEISRMDLTDPELPRRAFDVVFLGLTWAHLPRRGPLLEAVSASLVPGGSFVLTALHPTQLAQGGGAVVRTPFRRPFEIRTWSWDLEQDLLEPARRLGLVAVGRRETGLPEREEPAVLGICFRLGVSEGEALD